MRARPASTSTSSVLAMTDSSEAREQWANRGTRLRRSTFGSLMGTERVAAYCAAWKVAVRLGLLRLDLQPVGELLERGAEIRDRAPHHPEQRTRVLLAHVEIGPAV